MTPEELETVRFLADFFLAQKTIVESKVPLEQAKDDKVLRDLLMERLESAIQKRAIAEKYLSENLTQVQFLRTKIITRKAV